jgi:molecular chaperone DnaK
MSDKVVVGIDLGTTTSEACIYRDNKYKHMKSSLGKTVIPSVVGYDKDTQSIIAGDIADGKAKGSPENYVYEVKRKMGTDAVFELGDKKYSATEISAETLKYIKKYCEDYYGEPIENAVITVPANFNNNQRQDTKRAAELAGFNVERVVAEPTAAALAYCMENTDADDFVKLMVYDLGGGTFDVAVGEYHGGVLDIKGASGDNHLGGKDFDDLLANMFFDKIIQQHGVDLRKDTFASFSVKRECENLKKELSFQESSSINIPFLTAKDGKPIGLSESLTRKEFEDMISAKIEQTEKAIEGALKAAGYKPEDIDLVLLVGGSTRIPLVRETVKKLMKSEPKADIDPDLAVSLGAAMQAAIITGESDGVIMDVVIHSMGTSVQTEYNGQVLSGVYSQIIPPNGSMLKPFPEKYSTSYDNQDSINFEVYQKPAMVESIWANEMDYLGSKEITGIPPNKAGDESLTATFTYNLNGILEVKIEIDSTGEIHTFEIDATSATGSNPTLEIESKSDSEYLDWENYVLAKQYGSTIKLAEKKLAVIEHDELRIKLLELMKAICEDNSNKAEALDDEINDVLFELED